MYTLFIVLLTVVNHCAGFSIELNDSDYARMPPLLYMDPFESCLQQTGDVYCMVDLALVSDGDSELLTMIHKYSEHTSTHFNHSNLRRGLCVTESCKHFNTAGTTVTKLELEACLNRTFEEKYNLRTLVTKFSCDEYGAKREEIDYADICVGVVVSALVFLAIVGSFIDILFTKSDDKSHSLFINFSLIRHWRRLTAPYEDDDTRKKLFKSLHGVKVLIIIFVILGHIPYSYTWTAKDFRMFEENFNHLPQYILFNGNMVVQTYFVISGLLLIYKLQHYEKNNKVDYYLVPKAIADRWLRLIPPYAFTMLIIATWLKFFKSGPIWESTTGMEIKDCRQRGWLGLVLLNNYAYDYQCVPQTWHLSADMQLYCLGLIIYLLARNNKRKKSILALALLIGLLCPAVVTYVHDLDALLIVSPKNTQNFISIDPTSIKVYKNGFTNLPSYVIGLILGYLINHLLGTNFQVDKYKKYRIIYWSLLPACCIPLLLGSIFYHEPGSILLRVLFATFAKPFFGLLVAILILGMVFKHETVYRGFFEWEVWVPLSRLSYCAFLVHFIIIRLYTSSKTEPVEMSPSNTLFMLVLFIVCSFAVGLLLWLLVEAPIISLVHFYTAKGANHLEKHSPTIGYTLDTTETTKQKTS